MMTREEAEQKLMVEFAERLKTARDGGMVDFKFLPNRAVTASAMAIIWTLNNALKIADEDDTRTYSVDEVDQIIPKPSSALA